ncbi:O-antigen ligase family protein [Schaalia odontolytica]
MTYEASAVSDAVGSDRDDALRARMMRYTVAAMFFVGFAGKGVRGIFGEIGSLVPMLILLVSFVVLFRTSGRSLLLRRFPTTTCMFVAWCALTCVWSVAPLQSAQYAVVSSALTFVSIAVAVALPLTELVGALILSLQWIIGSSFALEALVAFFGRGPLAPPILWGRGLLPASYYWVHGLLLEGGPIQGFPGNRNPLAFIALLLAVCLILRYMQTKRDRLVTLFWLGACGAVLVLTQSATVALSTVGCLVVIAGLVVQRRVPERLRLRVVGGFAGFGVLTAIAAFFCRHAIADAFGRSPDMSGRSVIWHAVATLIVQRPIGGWGWFIGWPTWMEPFASLVIRPDGTPTNQAHNVYVEAALTTGFVGAGLVTIAIVWTLYRVVKVAVVHIDDNLWDVIPAVIMIAMFIQSFTESRLLFEGNWMLFVMIATWVKVRGEVPVVWPSAARQHLEYS